MSKLTDRLLYAFFAIVFILVIGGIVLPNIIGRAPGAFIKATESQIARLAIAVETFHMDMKRAPKSLDELANTTREFNGEARPYVKRVFLNDPWGGPYIYVISEGEESFEIISLGADGQEGGDGENADIRLNVELPSDRSPAR